MARSVRPPSSLYSNTVTDAAGSDSAEVRSSFATNRGMSEWTAAQRENYAVSDAVRLVLYQLLIVLSGPRNRGGHSKSSIHQTAQNPEAAGGSKSVLSANKGACNLMRLRQTIWRVRFQKSLPC